jgi:two-component system sensor histidine kinase KdpD
MNDGRPNPDALLAQAQQAQRGKLKIFLGAAPGVGKTFEMLSAAQKKRRDGVDVVVGIVETHRRRETEDLVAGLELIPRRKLNYKGRELDEMDIDAILARAPRLVLVDELAHTNAEGSRHPKRHQDVEELLAAGIDVYSTLNIQHVESLNDVVAQITHVRVQETVPDSVLDAADEIEVVDLTPDELMERLREGKVYQGDGGARALGNYFTPSNLTALRELALRRTAERVDEQLREHRRVRGVSEVWAAGERVMICINESPSSQQLVRHAKRVADRLDAPWMVVYLENARTLQLSESQRDHIAQTLRFAETLGAETLSLPGVGRIADDVLRIAREHNVSQLIVGKSHRSRWFQLLHGSVVHELVRHSGNITVQVIAEAESAGQPTATAAGVTRPWLRKWSWGHPGQYLASLFYVAVATLVGISIDRLTDLPNISLIFLAAVLVSATRHGLAPALFTAGLSSLCYNYFLLEPIYTFTISDPDNVLALVAFIAVALLTSHLTSRARDQTRLAAERAEITTDLLNFSRRLAGARKLDELLFDMARQAGDMLQVDVALLTPETEGLRLRAAIPADTRLNEADLAAAHWCLEKGQAAGRGSDTLPGAMRLFLPLKSGALTLGVIGVRRDQEDFQLAPSERRLLDALIDLAAIAIERIRLAKDMDQAKMLAETEKLRSALLNSISHDLRTPLASIHGAISSLRSYGTLHSAAARAELLETAQDETERMTRFVNNLLDMTRLDSGALSPKAEACDVQDIVGSAVRRTTKLLAGHKLVLSLEKNLPMLKLDFVLAEQVLTNLLDNAAKYSPVGSTIEVIGTQHRFAVTLAVRDEGPGIPEEDRQHIFDVFYRVKNTDRQLAGTGLGLTICRGFVQAMGGRISASNRQDRSGSVFEIEFPTSLIADRATDTGARA